MSLFFEVVLPVLLIFIVGFVLQKWKKVNVRSISVLALYVLIPSLVFRSLYKADLNGDYFMMIIFSFALLYSILFINKLYTKIRKYPQSVESGLILSTAFMNAGNYGAPIVLFAFGEKGFAYSVLFLVIQQIIMTIYGVYYAAKGKGGIGIAIGSVFKMPPTYAAIFALVLNLFHVKIPDNLFAPIDLIGDATIPVVMLVLGMQLAQIKLKNLQVGKISFGVIVRLIISPLLAFGIALILPINPLLQKVLIVSAAMPSAATTTMYAVQFDSEPDLVSSITMVTTILSIFTITILLLIIGT